ncbi:MAG: SDR family oxidoreductase [Alphaproteobacteria bacterium]
MNNKKWLLITGGAQRIGHAIALHLASLGYGIVVHYHRAQQEAQALVALLQAQGHDAMAIQADLLQADAIHTLIKAITMKIGVVHGLINNAALFARDELRDNLNAESMEKHWRLNCLAPVLLTQQFAHQLPTTQYGVVVNILDQRVWNITPHFISYSLSKSALWAFTQSAALALAPQIRVNAVGPGFVLPAPNQTAEQLQEKALNQPLQRMIHPQEVAEAVAFLIRSPAITGQMIAIDGGQHLAWQFAPAKL